MRFLRLGVLAALGAAIVAVGIAAFTVSTSQWSPVGFAFSVDSDGDGIPDPVDPASPQPGEDFCPSVAEDPDGIGTGDGCPESDVSVIAAAEEAYSVASSTTTTRTVEIWIQNGNYPAHIVANVLTVSPIGACEASVVPAAGDLFMPFNTDENNDGVDETFHYLLEWEFDLAAGEVLHTTRDYELTCLQTGNHSFLIQVNAAPMLPVVEENVSNLINVVRIYPAVTVAPPSSADSDGDGYSDAAEGFLGTNASLACGAAAWPPDFNDTLSVNVFDVNMLKPAFFSAAPEARYDTRLDLQPDGGINVFDVNRLKPDFFTSCVP